jgi:hypothetical protein
MRGVLRRWNMHLDSYDCELCLLQKVERLRHLFYRCSFAKNCWTQIGVTVPTWLKPDVIPRSEITKMKPPYVCPGCLIHTYSNNMINRCHIQ